MFFPWETTTYRATSSVADRRAERTELLACSGAVMPVAAEAFERDENAAMVGVEAIRSRERCRSRELAQHLAIAWAADVDLVEERRDRRVVPTEELETLERAVVVLLEVLLRGDGRILHRRDRIALAGPFPRGRMVRPWRRCAPSASASPGPGSRSTRCPYRYPSRTRCSSGSRRR